MKLNLILVILATLSHITPAHAVDRVGQGAGISENNIAFAYEYLDKYLQMCLALSGCLDPGDQTAVVQKIYSDIKSERGRTGQIGFRSQIRDGIFNIDGKIRVAKTWPYVGAPILFNLDELYAQDASGKIQGITIQQAVGWLVHEMGHHHGVLDHDWLDDLGHRVSRVLDGRIFSNMLSPDRSNIQGMSVFFDYTSQGLQATQVLVSDGPNLYDVAANILNVFQCPKQSGTPSALVGLALWNFMWRDIGGANPVLVGFAKPYCELASDHSIWVAKGFGVQIQTRLTRTIDLKWAFDPTGFSLRQVTCATEPLICAWDLAESFLKKRFVQTMQDFSPITTEVPGRDLNNQEEVP